jgi:hypothetical protein
MTLHTQRITVAAVFCDFFHPFLPDDGTGNIEKIGVGTETE